MIEPATMARKAINKVTSIIMVVVPITIIVIIIDRLWANPMRTLGIRAKLVMDETSSCHDYDYYNDDDDYNYSSCQY